MKYHLENIFYIALSILWFFVALSATITFDEKSPVVFGFMTPIFILFIKWLNFAMWSGLSLIDFFQKRRKVLQGKELG